MSMPDPHWPVVWHPPIGRITIRRNSRWLFAPGISRPTHGPPVQRPIIVAGFILQSSVRCFRCAFAANGPRLDGGRWIRQWIWSWWFCHRESAGTVRRASLARSLTSDRSDRRLLDRRHGCCCGDRLYRWASNCSGAAVGSEPTHSEPPRSIHHGCRCRKSRCDGRHRRNVCRVCT